jgi:hypothetical protein
LGLLTFVALICAQFIDGHKILMISPFPATSHWLWIKTFANELLNRGHQVSIGAGKCLFFDCPEQKPEIKINTESSHTILSVDLRKLPLISIFKIKKEQIAEPLISDYLCI